MDILRHPLLSLHRQALAALCAGALLVASPVFAADEEAPPAEDAIQAVALEKTLQGPIPAIVTQVYDGDTIKVEAQPWLGQKILVSVRLNGIDAPELRGRCDEEVNNAKKAREALAALVPVGSRVTLHNVTNGKYAGRVVADVQTPDGRRVEAELLRAKFVRPYDGGRRESWCPRT